MHFPKVLSAIALAALYPGISVAHSDDRALKACVDAFAARLSPAGTSAVKLEHAHHEESPFSDYYAHEFTFTLQARDQRSNKTLAAVSCSATHRGTVIEMRTLRKFTNGVKLASR